MGTPDGRTGVHLDQEDAGASSSRSHAGAWERESLFFAGGTLRSSNEETESSWSNFLIAIRHWFENHCVLVDSGFQGFGKDYQTQKLSLPQKRKKNSNLTELKIKKMTTKKYLKS